MKRLLTLGIVSLLVCSAGAATFDIVAERTDGPIDRGRRNDDLTWSTTVSYNGGTGVRPNDNVRVGVDVNAYLDGTTTQDKMMCMIIPFLLPDLGGETIVSASLEVTVIGTTYSAPPVNLDLYGVRTGVASSATTADFFSGVYDTDASSTAIQQDFITSAIWPGAGGAIVPDEAVTASAAGVINLTAWLQSLYDGGAQAGEYVFLRLSPTTTEAEIEAGTSGDGYYMISSANTDLTGQEPTLTIITGTVPEPMTMSLLALGGIALIRKKRKA